jgi:2-polyprenyl-3-methyl-5-hydroxy-6-metoxy-1,4-benzoquinol methylase
MATDIAKVLANLTSFYDFRNKSVVHVGAGGGQFIGYASDARHVLAVDPDAAALATLRAAIDTMGLGDRIEVRQARFESLSDKADVVFFEFCLHEIDDPDAMLLHARTLAPETLVIDHDPGSRWAWHTAETEKAARSWAAIDRAGVSAHQVFVGRQLFPDVDALVARLASLGEPAVSRARALEGVTGIDIEMIYRVALLKRPAATAAPPGPDVADAPRAPRQ